MRIPGQLGLDSETLSQNKTKQNNKNKKPFLNLSLRK
jgi:hypothetical protein